MRSDLKISTVLRDASGWSAIAQQWAGLVNLSPYASFFLTPEWVESWLEIFGPLFKVEILLFHAGDTLAGACLLVYRTTWQGPFRIRRVYLNTGGEDEADETMME